MPRGPRSKKINPSEESIKAKLGTLLEENNEERRRENKRINLKILFAGRRILH